jgi:hypothetical protein
VPIAIRLKYIFLSLEFDNNPHEISNQSSGSVAIHFVECHEIVMMKRISYLECHSLIEKIVIDNSLCMLKASRGETSFSGMVMSNVCQ